MARCIRAMIFLGLAVCAGLAVAQESKPLNLSIRFGTFRPQFSGARQDDDQWPAFGIESRWRNLRVSTSNPGQSNYLTLSFDSFSAGDWRATPVLVNYIARSNELYFVVGGGPTFSEEPGESGKVRLGIQFGAGWDFFQGKTPLFVEAKYFLTTNNDHFNGLGIFFGVRL